MIAPGLYGIVSECARARERWSLAVKARAPLVDVTPDEEGGKFRLRHVCLGPPPIPSRHSTEHRVTVALHGTLDNESTRQRSPDEPIDGALSLIRDSYLKGGISRLGEQLAGAYCVAIGDMRSGKVYVLNDRLGSHPLYWGQCEAGVIFGASVLSLIAAGGMTAEFDICGAAEFLRFGHLLENRTLARGISLLPPGSWLAVDLPSERASVVEYARPDDFFAPRAVGKAPYATVADALDAAVNRSVDRAKGNCGITLSGGLDSRALLVALQTHPDRVRSFTCGVSGCADERIGAALASQCGLEHRFLAHDERIYSDIEAHLRRFVRETDGMYLSHGLTELQDTASLEADPCRLLFRGHLGELAKLATAWPFHIADDVRGGDVFHVIDRLLTRFNFVASDPGLFTPTFAHLFSSHPRRALISSLEGVNLQAGDLCAYLYLTQHHRRFSISSLAPFRRFCDVAMPFTDEVFLRQLLGLPLELREGRGFHRFFIARSPELARIADSNTGAPVLAGRFRTALTERLVGGLAKFKIPGFRHYHRIDQVAKHFLLPLADAYLLSPRTHVEAIVQHAGIRAIVAEIRGGRYKGVLLLLALLTLEIWMQEVESAAAN